MVRYEEVGIIEAGHGRSVNARSIVALVDLEPQCLVYLHAHPFDWVCSDVDLRFVARVHVGPRRVATRMRRTLPSGSITTQSEG